MTGIDRSPATLSQWVSLTAGLIALTACGYYSWPALGIGATGFVLLGLSLVRGTTVNVTTGAFLLLSAAIMAGVQNAPVLPVLVSVVFTVVAWDTGGSAISIGEQLGREARTLRIEIVQITMSITVGTLAAVTGYAIYHFGASGQPVTAVIFFLIGAILLIATLD